MRKLTLPAHAKCVVGRVGERSEPGWGDFFDNTSPPPLTPPPPLRGGGE